MLYIYSGEVPELDEVLRADLGEEHVFTVIPCGPHEIGAAKYMADCFRYHGIRARVLGTRYYKDRHRLRRIIMGSDGIFLMGGNTFEFLNYAKDIDLFKVLADYEEEGGLIAAESAGSIILSKRIDTAWVPSCHPDENTIGLTDFEGMGRLPFHISPHFDPESETSNQDRRELQQLANETDLKVVVLHDGDGLIINEQIITAQFGSPFELDPENVLE
ncbi:MAG: Type 1 glutamine amidotransferase-like domain-containing protein [Gammaproteobacteria bacterium]|nr:Type 1 glutamine amidotransferase-like domain-containing protein [Gammaproteobacteria bacterium]